ncbi:MAG: nuclear transport factor 2 family protein [Thermoleophilia bacterium]
MGLAEDLTWAWGSHDPTEVAGLFAPHGVREEFILPGAKLVGRDAIAAQVGMYMTAGPDCRLEIRRELVVDDRHIVMEWLWGGLHTGDVDGWPARGETVRLPGVAVYDLSAGLIRRENIYTDMAIMLAGAGMLAGVELALER